MFKLTITVESVTRYAAKLVLQLPTSLASRQDLHWTKIFDPSKQDHVERIANELGVPLSIFSELVLDTPPRKGSYREAVVEAHDITLEALHLNEADLPQFEVKVHEIKGSKRQSFYGAAGIPEDALRQALYYFETSDDDGLTEPVISWKDKEGMVAVDCDIISGHGGTDLSGNDHSNIDAPSFHYLAAVVEMLSPKPRYWWQTHGGGLRLIYTRHEPFTAVELAGLAVQQLCREEPMFRFELKCDTRHPGYPRLKTNGTDYAEPLEHCEALTLDGYLVSSPPWSSNSSGGSGGSSVNVGHAGLYYLQSINEADMQQWLADRDMHLDQRYPHSYCPINPSDVTEGDVHRSPVYVNRQGIFCHLCQGKGDVHHVSWGNLLGCGGLTQLGRIVRDFVHWGQAKYFFRDAFPLLNENIHRAIYRGLLRATHFENLEGAECQTKMFQCFDKLTDKLYYCMTGWKLEDHGEVTDLLPILRTLPYVNDVSVTVTRNGRVIESKHNNARVAQLSSNPQSDSGYMPCVELHGPILWGQHNSYRSEPSSPRISVYNSSLKRFDYGADPLPRIYRDDERHRAYYHDIDAVEEYFTDLLPGLNFNYLKALLVGAGLTQAGYPFPISLVITGPTQAGKSSTVQLAGGILGVSPVESMWRDSSGSSGGGDKDRMAQAVAAAVERSGLLVYNEFLKTSGKNETKLLDFLNLTPDLFFHKLYHGQTRMSAIPLIVFTDVHFPSQIASIRQIMRRIVHMRLNGTSDWIGRLSAMGQSAAKDIRLIHEPLIIEMCNSLLSWVANDVLPTLGNQEPQALLAAVAGVDRGLDRDKYLNIGDRDFTPGDRARFLFEHICNYEEPVNGSSSGAGYGSGYGPGFKVISLYDQQVDFQFIEAWRVCQSDNDDVRSVDCLLELDLSAELSLDVPVQLDVHPRSTSRQLIVRFAHQPTNPAHRGLYNEELQQFRVSL